MKNNKLLMVVVSMALLCAMGCQNHSKPADTESITSGSATFVVDESFSPIVDEEIYVFKNLSPDAKPKVLYRTENQVIGLLLNDSVRFAVISRKLTGSELGVLKKRQLTPTVNRFAVDAVALIVNQASNDTTITVGEFKKLLNGENKSGKNIVFDNPNSSIVKYLQDFSGSKILDQKNVYSLKSDKEVISYVGTHPGAIGVTGFSWLNDPDKDYAAAVKNIKVVSVRNENSKEDASKYFQPSQTTLALKQYPLTRDLYIVNATGKQGLGSGFENFVLGDRGQRVILRSGLLPNTIPERDIVLKHN